MSLLKKTVLYNLCMAILYILAGVMMIAKPELTGKITCYALAGMFIFTGAVRIVDFIITKDDKKYLDTSMAVGCVHIFFGGYLLFRPEYFASLLAMLYGLLLILNAALNLQQGIHLFKLKDKLGYLQILIGFIGAFFGLYIACRKAPIPNTLSIIVGVFILLIGAFEIFTAYKLAISHVKKPKETKKTEDEIKYNIID